MLLLINILTVPKDDIFFVVTDDILAKLPGDSLPDDTEDLIDCTSSLDLLVDIGATTNSSEKDTPSTPLNDDLIELIDTNFNDILDIPVIIAEKIDSNTVDESINLMNFDVADRDKTTDKESLNESLDLLDL